MDAVELKNIDILFGDDQRGAIRMLDAGGTREEILAETGVVLGAAGVNLKVAHGSLTVLMGLSGSGKSTILRAINRLNKVARGEVLVHHQGKMVDVAKCGADTLREVRTTSVAMVFQQFALLPWRTVRENVGLGLELRGTGAAERKRVVDEKLHMVGLDRWADKYAHELSGGMQQRVGLARAFATDAEILLMDEPFSALDPLIRDKLQDELLDLQAQLKKTIVFVSHDLDEAMKLGNQIAIMEHGRIVQAGTAEDILLRPSNAYVAEFTKHTNPLNVLKGTAVMTGLAGLKREGEDVTVGPDGALRVRLDGEGRPVAASSGGREVPIRAGEPGWSDAQGRGEEPGLLTAPAATRLRELIELKNNTRHPLLLLDGDRRLVGRCGEEEIYKALVQRRGGEADPAAAGKGEARAPSAPTPAAAD